jgi:hypothetical protein
MWLRERVGVDLLRHTIYISVPVVAMHMQATQRSVP